MATKMKIAMFMCVCVCVGKLLSWNQKPLYTVFQDNRQIKAKCHNKTKNGALHVRRRILPIAFDKHLFQLGNIVLFAFDSMRKYCCLLWDGSKLATCSFVVFFGFFSVCYLLCVFLCTRTTCECGFAFFECVCAQSKNIEWLEDWLSHDEDCLFIEWVDWFFVRLQ